LVEIALTCGARADAAMVVVVLEVVVVVVAATGAATCTQRKLRPLLAVQRNVPALVTRSRPATLQGLPGWGAADATAVIEIPTTLNASRSVIRRRLIRLPISRRRELLGRDWTWGHP
jgi:hypothetical protein